MQGTELYSSARSITRTLAQLADADALKTSVATPIAPIAYSAAALNGALANPGPAVFDPPRYVSVTTSASGATYNTTDGIVFAGKRGGVDVSETLMLTDAAGNETIVGNQAFDQITSITVPAQLGGGGAFTFGVSGIAARLDEAGDAIPYRAIRAGAAGNARIGYQVGAADTLPMGAGETAMVLVERLYGALTTIDPVTLYW